MKPKKSLVDAAVKDGSMDRLNMLLSAAHLLNCEANSLIEEAADVMRAKGLLLGDLKKLHNDFLKCADRYFKEFSTLVVNDQCKMDMFEACRVLIRHSEPGQRSLSSGSLKY